MSQLSLKNEPRLAELLKPLRTGDESEIVIEEDGAPVAKIVPLPKTGGVRLGAAEGRFHVPEPDPELDRLIERMFLGEEKWPS